MQPSIYSRNGIPFYYEKTDRDFKQDIYERYHDMVLRQSALHLADQLWGNYPFEPILKFAEKHYPKKKGEEVFDILEIGCGVGRWIATLAKLYPQSSCWGIDYSYQMLKRAKEFWLDGQEVAIDLNNKGLNQLSLRGEQLQNLNLGLAKAEKLPFDADSQNLVLSSFLLDRLEEPLEAIGEVYRILNPGGQFIVVSPLNFKQAVHWERYYPPHKLSILLEEIGFKIKEWKEDIMVNEPLDGHGNMLRWKCLGFVVEK